MKLPKSAPALTFRGGTGSEAFDMISCSMNSKEKSSNQLSCRIIGSKKQPETRSVIRWCKERGIDHQFVDIREHPTTAGELQRICSGGRLPADLIDEQNAFYRSKGYAWREFDPLEELLEHPELMKIPVVRAGGRSIIAPDEDALRHLFARN